MKARTHNYESIYEYIVEFKKRNDGTSPSVREIMRDCGISSSSHCLYILQSLDDAGKIRLMGRKGSARSIHVVGGSWTVSQ